MMFFDGAPSFSVLVPLALLVGSLLVSKAFKLSLPWTVAGGLLPLALPFLSLPFSEEFVKTKPEFIIGGGWSLLMGGAVGWIAVRPLVKGAVANVGLVKLLYIAVLSIALGVTALLLANPQLLQEIAPGWKGSMGLVLLCASLLSMSLALARVVKATVLFTVWSAVSLILASEIFLGKLPQDLLREDLKKIESMIPRVVIDGITNRIQAASSVSKNGLGALVLSGSPATSEVFNGKRGFGDQLEDVLRRGGVEIQVRDLSRPNSSIYDLRDAAKRSLQSEKPDIVFIVGWAGDAVRGSNSYGIAGLTELKARERIDSLQQLFQYPLVSEIFDSRLFRYMTDDNRPDSEARRVLRVPVNEYRSELSALVSELQGAGVTVVLISEPSTLYPEEQEYRAALEDVAQHSGVLFIDAEQVLQERSQGRHLAARGRLISSDAVNELALATVQRLVEYASSREQGRQLAASLQPELNSDLSPEYQLTGALGESVNFVVDPRKAAGDLIFTIRSLDRSSHRYYRVVFSVNGKFVADKRLNDRDAARVRFRIPDEFMELPFVELSVRTVASPGEPSDSIGSSDTTVPVPLSTSSDEESSLVRVGAEEVISGSEGVIVGAIDPRSGEVLDWLTSNQSDQVNRWITQQPWGTVVAGAARASLSPESLKYLGLPATAAGPSAFVGLAGSRGATGVIAQGEGRQEVALGSKSVWSLSRFLLEEVVVEASGRSLLEDVSGAHEGERRIVR